MIIAGLLFFLLFFYAFGRTWLFLHLAVDHKSESSLAQTALIFKIPPVPAVQPGVGRSGGESPFVVGGPPPNLEIYLCKHSNLYSRSGGLQCNCDVSDIELEWASGIMTDVCLWVWRLVLS
jgi:hypothetical protein